MSNYQHCQTIKIFKLSKFSSNQNVQAIKIFKLSKYSSYQNIQAIKIFKLSKCSSYQHIQAINMFKLSKCSSYQYVQAIKMFKLSICSSYQNVQAIKFFKLSNLQNCLIYTSKLFTLQYFLRQIRGDMLAFEQMHLSLKKLPEDLLCTNESILSKCNCHRKTCSCKRIVTS